MRKTRKPRFISEIASYGAAALIALSPMLEGVSTAQKTPVAQQSETRIMAGQSLQLTNGKQSPWVYVILKEKDIIPSKKLDGPKNLALRFYPVVELKRLVKNGGEVSIGIEYSLVKEGEQKDATLIEGRTRISNFRVLQEGVLDLNKYAIGTPVDFTVQIRKGDFVFSALSKGFIEIVRIDTIIEKRIPKPLVRKTVPKQEPKKVIAIGKEAGHSNLPLFVFEGERTHLHKIGPGEDSGDLNQALAAINFRLGHGLSANAGLMFSSFGLSHETGEAVTSMRSISANATAGLILEKGNHIFIARGFGGYRAMLKDIKSKIGDSSGQETYHQAEYGGAAGYCYGHVIEAIVSGSNNPFNPLSAKISGTLPWGWVKDAYPWLEADVLWIHTMESLQEENLIGGIKLGVNNVYARLSGGIPIWRLGPVVPSLLVSGDLNASEAGFHHADIMLGAAVAARLGRFDFNAGGAVSPITVTPYFFLKMSVK